MTIVIETVSPQRAAEILALNTGNRIVRKREINRYARDMKSGNWKLTGSPIVLNGEKLLDGQHRLLACIEAGVPFTTAVLYGADESIHFAIDRGVKRTVGDELRWRGEVDVHQLASALNVLWNYEHDSLVDPKTDPSTQEIVALLDTRPGIRAAIKVAQKVNRSVPVPVSVFAVVYYLLSTLHGEEIADVFAEKVESGVELVEGDPLLVLRGYAINVAGNRQTRPRREEWLAVVIKAANHWLLGRPVKFLRWRRVGPTAESFPRLIGPDEAAS